MLRRGGKCYRGESYLGFACVGKRVSIAQFLGPEGQASLVVGHEEYWAHRQEQKIVVTACRRVLADYYSKATRVTSAFFVHLAEEVGGELTPEAESLARAYVMSGTDFTMSRCFRQPFQRGALSELPQLVSAGGREQSQQPQRFARVGGAVGSFGFVAVGD